MRLQILTIVTVPYDRSVVFSTNKTTRGLFGLKALFGLEELFGIKALFGLEGLFGLKVLFWTRRSKGSFWTRCLFGLKILLDEKVYLI
jgi:hypothetical protein